MKIDELFENIEQVMILGGLAFGALLLVFKLVAGFTHSYFQVRGRSIGKMNTMRKRQPLKKKETILRRESNGICRQQN